MYKHVNVVIILAFFAILFFSCASNKSDSSPAYYGESLESFRSSSPSDEDRMISYSVTLGLVVKNSEETKKLLVEQVKNSNGYIVRETDDSISTRIPAENMDNFVGYSKTLGKTENERKTGTDITDQYQDNMIRLESLKTVRSRYLVLLDRAVNVNEILGIERELERVNTEIDRLEGRIKHAEQSVAYSLITVGFRERTKPGPIGWVFFGLYHAIKWLFVWD